MSAIAGLVHFDQRRPDHATIERMQSVLAPYGPDAQMARSAGHVAVLRTLLRSTPEDSLDAQPLNHQASGLMMVFDGRLDNRDELITSLGLRPGEARTLADSDLVFRACLRWGEDTPGRLLGDFALACCNTRERTVWLARDPMGQRPLYWHLRPELLAFASMPKGLLAVPEIPKAVCQEVLHDFLCLLPMTGSESFYRDIHRVEPGQVVHFRDGRMNSRRYHDFCRQRELKPASDQACVEALDAELSRAVACRLRSSGPIASHLSSGLDSGTVTATAARLLAANDRKLLAYTAVPRQGFEGPVPRHWHADEGPAARAVAGLYPNIEHRLIRTGERSPLDGIEQIVEAMDRPPLNLCNLNWCRAIEEDAAERGVRVMLTGTRGNASISYDGLPRLPALLRRGRWLSWWREINALRSNNRALGGRRLVLQSIGPYLPLFIWSRLARRHGMAWSLNDYCPAGDDFLDRMQQRMKVSRGDWDPHFRPWADGRSMRISMLEWADIGDYNAASDMAGLSVRDPTADLRLVELCLAIPDDQYLRDGQTRWLLRRLMRGHLPDQVVDAQSKGYQAADWYESLGNSLLEVNDLISGLQRDDIDRFIDLDEMEQSVADWPQGRWRKPGRNERRYRLKLLRGLSAGAFVQKTEAGNR